MPTGSPFADVQLRMRELGKQMDDIFAQTFRSFGNSFGGSGFASSVDLREQKDRYVARVYVPNGDTSKVNAAIENGELRITMQGAEAKNGVAASENFQQIISLPQPVRADQMQVDRKPNVVVITIPKSNSAVAVASPQPSPGASVSGSTSAIADWDQRMIDDMRQMQARMDEVFRNVFPSDILNGTNMLRLGSSVNVEDQKDKYTVHFILPDRDLSNVKVDYQNGELRLTAQEEKKTSSNAAPNLMERVERGRYEEMITLPGPVKESEMKVNRQANAVVVTLPKA